MKKVTIKIDNCLDCPKCIKAKTVCDTCHHNVGGWKCTARKISYYLSEALLDAGIPKWCPLEDADDKKD